MDRRSFFQGLVAFAFGPRLVKVAAATVSTSITTGALTGGGGVGIAGSLYIIDRSHLKNWEYGIGIIASQETV